MPLSTGRLWIDRLSRELPGFNEQPFNLLDLYRFCEQRGVLAEELPMRRLHGCSFYEDGDAFLMVNNLLSEPERIIAGFHELAHLLLHEPDDVFCSTGVLRNHRKIERQAQIVGVIALLPIRKLHEDLSDYPRQIVEYRQQIWWELGL